MTAMHDHFRRFARYNRWANRRLYAACAALPEEEYLRARPSFFGSLHATLNHILAGDAVWMGRLVADPAAPTKHAETAHADLASLRAAREVMDERIVAYVDGLDAAALDATLTYRNMNGDEWSDPRAALLAHFFNHQTHHRGQCHGLLSHAGAAPPPLDLILYIREAE